MKQRDRLIQISSLTIVGFICILLLISCSPSVKMPKLDSSQIKAYKTVTVYANRSTITNTGVYVDKGDLYSFIVTGRASFSKNYMPVTTSEDSGAKATEFLGATIDSNYQFMPPVNMTVVARLSGEIGLYFKDGSMDFETGKSLTPKYYKNNSGSFKVEIIVWNTKDIDYISAYFKDLEIQNPENKLIKNMDDQVIHLKSYIN